MPIWKGLTIALVMAAALADEAPAETAAVADVVPLADGLAKRDLQRLRRDPGLFVERAADLILSFGTDLGIDAAGVERSIAADRARVRAREVERLMRGDLDNDGRVDADEIANLISAGSGYGRGRIRLSFETADRDRDGVVVAQELALFADAVAMDHLPETDAVGRRAFMLFDLDGDGLVTLEEVMAAVGALQQVTPAQVRKDI